MVLNCLQWHDTDEHASPECFKTITEVVRRACDEARARPPSTENVRSWHRQAFQSVVPIDYYAGHFRQDDPSRVCLGQNVEVGGFPGFPYQLVSASMAQLVHSVAGELTSLEVAWPALDDLTRARRIATVVGTAIGMFVHIHPFINGNGRTSRILWTALLRRIGIPPQATILRRPGPPYGDVMHAAMKGDYSHAVAMVFVALSKAPIPARLS